MANLFAPWFLGCGLGMFRACAAGVAVSKATTTMLPGWYLPPTLQGQLGFFISPGDQGESNTSL